MDDCDMAKHDHSADVGCSSFAPGASPPLVTHTHSPVLVNSADMLHATKRTLQMKQT